MESTTVRRFTRSTRERIFAGLCGGSAEYLGIDPALARIMFVAVTLITGVGPGIIVYLAGWIIVPQSDPTHATPRQQTTGSRRIVAMMLLAIGLLGLGIAAFLNEDESNTIAYLGPILVLVLATILLVKRQDATINSDTYSHSGGDMSGTATDHRRLRRSSRDKKIAGICGGFGEYFNVDPTLVRVLWILAVLLGGTGLLLYVILWIVMPLDGDPDLVTPRN